MRFPLFAVIACLPLMSCGDNSGSKPSSTPPAPPPSVSGTDVQASPVAKKPYTVHVITTGLDPKVVALVGPIIRKALPEKGWDVALTSGTFSADTPIDGVIAFGSSSAVPTIPPNPKLSGGPPVVIINPKEPVAKGQYQVVTEASVESGTITPAMIMDLKSGKISTIILPDYAKLAQVAGGIVFEAVREKNPKLVTGVPPLTVTTSNLDSPEVQALIPSAPVSMPAPISLPTSLPKPAM